MKIKVCAGARCTMLGSDIIYNRLSDFVKEFNNKVYKGDLDIQDIKLEIEMITCNDECKKNKKKCPSSTRRRKSIYKRKDRSHYGIYTR